MKIAFRTLPALPLVAAMMLGSVMSNAASAGDDALKALDLRQVKVGGEIGRRIDVTVQNNLLVLDADKNFLAPFRTKETHEGYTGLGKLLDAAVRLAAYTHDQKVIAFKQRLVEQTIKVQEPDGYIGAMAAPNRMWGLWDIHEMGYIIYALTSDYHYFGQQRSLAAARKAADYILGRWAQKPADWPEKYHWATSVALTGVERTLLALYRESGDRRYLDFCVRDRALPDWQTGIVIGRREPLEGHSYSYLVRCLAQLELCRIQPDEKLLRLSRGAAHFLTAQDGMTITGAAGVFEIWTDDQDGHGALGETCSTAYQLRLYDSLLRLEGNPRYGDLIERTIYNALFAAQSPDGRRIRYFVPMEGERKYYPEDNYCCPGNYRRIVADLPTMVYYRAGSGLAVNLYTPSETTVTLDGGLKLKARQETDYPTSGRVVIRLDPSQPATFPLQLRIPRWCQQASVAVNGKRWEKPIVAGQFLSIERHWGPGDRVTLDLPMKLRLVAGRKRQAGRAAVMRGPLVFCLNPSTQKSLVERKEDWTCRASLVTIDPATLKEVPGDGAARPGDVACTVRATADGFNIPQGFEPSLKLTEFPDPNGRMTYFRLPDLRAAVPDELVGEK
jgi:DUF1680 family protein